MRTTLAIDDDVLTAAGGLAQRRQCSLGEIISELARQALRRDAAGANLRNGVPLLQIQPGAMPVTMERVNQLRDDLP